MKKLVLFFITILSIDAAFAQQIPELAVAKVTYNFIHVRDTNNRSKPYEEEMLLMLGKNCSKFTSNVRFKQELEFMTGLESQIKANGGTFNGLSIKSNRKRATLNEDYFTFFNHNKTALVARLINYYLVEDSIPKIDWEIKKDTANFSGIKCQKATARFGGRNWIAWFASSLPFQAGPWKLNGLPGLIVEAYDDKKDIQFLFTGFEATNISEKDRPKQKVVERLDTFAMANEIKVNNKAIKTSKEELKKLTKASSENPAGFAKAQLSGTPFAQLAELASKSNMATPNANPAPITNNPIEIK
ncbi:GLPGLI family protein [Pedobacter sp.]